jgi:trehalose/maltose hydrolase-like predicted phosphorylase
VVENASLVNLPNWLDLRFGIGDGGWNDLAGVRVLEHRWALDLRRSLPNRALRLVDAAGRTTSVRQRRSSAWRSRTSRGCTQW